MKRLSFSVGVAVLAIGSIISIMILGASLGKFILFPALLDIFEHVLGFDYYDARAFAGFGTIISLAVGLIMFIIAMCHNDEEDKTVEVKEVVETSNT